MKSFLRILYLPYKWLIFIPFFIVNTAFFGSLAILLLFFLKPRAVSAICGGTWARLNAWATPVWVRVSGREHVDPDQSYVIVANHQSHYDIFLLYGWLGVDFKWVMKQELRKAPMIGVACDRLGHIFVDRSDRQAAIASLETAKERIRNGTSVFFFPEGTRSRSGDLRSFKKGAFRMALDLDLPILPVALVGTRRIMPPDSLDIFPGTARMIIHPPVAIGPYRDNDIEELMAAVRRTIESGLDGSERLEPASESSRQEEGFP
ncbi:MAG: lysophospholipid acyltransferase family protein [Desulfococcaceae bacterium]